MRIADKKSFAVFDHPTGIARAERESNDRRAVSVVNRVDAVYVILGFIDQGDVRTRRLVIIEPRRRGSRHITVQGPD